MKPLFTIPFALPVRSAGALLLVAALAGCGGGDGYSSAPPPSAAPPGSVPAEATSSASAWSQFVTRVIDMAAGMMGGDNAAPLHLEGVVPPTSETEEPVPLR